MSEDDYIISPRRRWFEHVEWRQPNAFWISLLSIVIATLSAVFSYQQKDAATRSAQAAERSASAAEDALRNTLRENRARLTAVLFNPSGLVAGKSPGGEILLHNRGRAKATRVVQRVWIDVMSADVKELPHPTVEADEAESLGPDSHLVRTVLLHRALTGHEIEEIRAGRKALFVYGEAEYSDETKQQRRLRWCAYMTDGPTASGMLPSCQFHNSSD